MTSDQKQKIRKLIENELIEADFEWNGEVMFCRDPNRAFDLNFIVLKIEEALR